MDRRWTVELTRAQIRAALGTAKRRIVQLGDDGVFGDITGEQAWRAPHLHRECWRHQIGAFGEMAAHVALGFEWLDRWDRHDPVQHEADIGRCGQVRTTTSPIGRLMVYRTDFPRYDSHLFVLVNRLDSMVFRLAGWAPAGWIKRRARWDAQGRGELPPGYLNPMRSLDPGRLTTVDQKGSGTRSRVPEPGAFDPEERSTLSSTSRGRR